MGIDFHQDTTVESPAWSLVLLAVAVVLGLVLAFTAGCSTLADQGLQVAREGRVLISVAPVSTDAQWNTAAVKYKNDEDTLETSNGTSGYAAWFATFATPPTP
jgi:hypothetical protein